MKRNHWLFGTAILLICFLSGCVELPGINTPDSGGSKIPGNSSAVGTDTSTQESSDLALLREEINQNGNIGAAFIGYVDSESTEEELYSYLAASETGQKYPFLSEAALVMEEGQELYAIVPPNENWTVTVYPSKVTEDGTYEDILNQPIYTGDSGEILLVRCNLSEIYSNVLIASTDSYAAISFRLTLSMESGRMAKADGVYDFSVYAESGSGMGSENPDLALLREEIGSSGSAAGLAFIGYVDSQSTEADLYRYLADSKTGQNYPFLSNAPVVMTEGQELYAIVPNEAGTVTVYPSGVTENGEYADDKSSPLYTGAPGEAVVVMCNLSEIYSNVLITATDGGGAIDFRPALSMENGHLAETPGVYDFSVYEAPFDEYAVETAAELLREIDEIKEAMEQGMELLYTGDTQIIEGRTCLLFALGTDWDGQFFRERYYAVCGNHVYAYDAVYDYWTPLGMG